MMDSTITVTVTVFLAVILVGLAVRSSRRYARYAYCNTRVRVMRTGLLAKRDFEIALKTSGLSDLAEFLREKGYKEIEELAVSHSGADLIELALNRNFLKSVSKIKSMSPAGLERLLGRWDVWNVKLLLRRILRPTAVSREELEKMLVPVGKIGEERLFSLAACKDAGELAGRLSDTEYGPILKKLDGEGADLGEIEDSLDRHYFETALSGLDDRDSDHKLMGELIRIEIDIKNILVYFRGLQQGREYGKMPGGTVQLMRGSDFDSALSSLEGTMYFRAVKAGMDEFLKNKSLSGMQRKLEQLYERKAIALSHAYPLSIGPVIGYLASKENEVRNLRIVARGRSNRMDENAIKEMLVLVGAEK